MCSPCESLTDYLSFIHAKNTVNPCDATMAVNTTSASSTSSTTTVPHPAHHCHKATEWLAAECTNEANSTSSNFLTLSNDKDSVTC